MNDRLLSFLGICRRARRLTIGAEAAVESMNRGKSELIIYARDFSRSSLKPVLEAAHRHSVKTLELNRGKDELSVALGKLCGVMSVEDKGFADKLCELIFDEQGGELYDKI